MTEVMAGLLLIAVGGLLALFGLRLALLRPRPTDLVGMVLAPLGIMLLWWGLARLFWPRFFGG